MIAELRLHEQITPDSQGDMGREAQEIHEYVEHVPALQHYRSYRHTVSKCTLHPLELTPPRRGPQSGFGAGLIAH